MEPGSYYHIYNRSINHEPLFREDENYRFFLRQYKYYLHEHVDTYAYCLMSAHFHFAIRVKERSPLQPDYKSREDFCTLPPEKPTGHYLCRFLCSRGKLTTEGTENTEFSQFSLCGLCVLCGSKQKSASIVQQDLRLWKKRSAIFSSHTPKVTTSGISVRAACSSTSSNANQPMIWAIECV